MGISISNSTPSYTPQATTPIETTGTIAYTSSTPSFNVASSSSSGSTFSCMA